MIPILHPALLLSFLLIYTQAAEPNLDKHIIPLYGNASLGYYYANLYIGNPGQQQSAIVDTGSGQLALPCSKCISCGRQHIHLPFDMSQSTTSKFITCESDHQLCRGSCHAKNNDPCTFGISYAEGSSLNGILVEDDIKFQRDSTGQAIRTTFGCTTRETNLFFTQAANGIFGLAPQRNGKLLQLLYETHTQSTGQQFLFSMCLARNGGHMTVGRSRSQIHKQGQIPAKTSFVDHRNLYTLTQVGAITLNNTVIRSTNQNLGIYGVFIDSGATFTYFPSNYYNKIVGQLQNSCAYHSERCMLAKGRGTGTCFRVQREAGKTIKDSVSTIFPSLRIQINGVIVEWSSQKYFLLRSLQHRQVCLGIQSLDRFLLGANWMVDRDITFNLKQKTIQIYSNSNCLMKELQAQRIPQGDPKIDEEDKKAKPEQHVSSTFHQQLPLYISGNENNEPLDYIYATFRSNNELYSGLFILVLIIFIFFVLLLLIGKFCRSRKGNKINQQHKKQIPEEQVDNIKSTQSILAQRTLSSQKFSQQIIYNREDDIIHIQGNITQN